MAARKNRGDTRCTAFRPAENADSDAHHSGHARGHRRRAARLAENSSLSWSQHDSPSSMQGRTIRGVLPVSSRLTMSWRVYARPRHGARGLRAHSPPVRPAARAADRRQLRQREPVVRRRSARFIRDCRRRRHRDPSRRVRHRGGGRTPAICARSTVSGSRRCCALARSSRSAGLISTCAAGLTSRRAGLHGPPPLRFVRSSLTAGYRADDHERLTPSLTASGSGASGESCDRSCSHAKKRRNARRWSVT